MHMIKLRFQLLQYNYFVKQWGIRVFAGCVSVGASHGGVRSHPSTEQSWLNLLYHASVSSAVWLYWLLSEIRGCSHSLRRLNSCLIGLIPFVPVQQAMLRLFSSIGPEALISHRIGNSHSASTQVPGAVSRRGRGGVLFFPWCVWGRGVRHVHSRDESVYLCMWFPWRRTWLDSQTAVYFLPPFELSVVVFLPAVLK